MGFCRVTRKMVDFKGEVSKEKEEKGTHVEYLSYFYKNILNSEIQKLLNLFKTVFSLLKETFL